MPGTADTDYDDFPYFGRAFNVTHPDRLAVVGALSGLQPAAVENCRVLELGCGDGGNLLPMAATLPGSQFFGIDLAAKPLIRGRGLAADLGLSNLKLEAMDIMDFPADAGPFDYIIAHGIYSWVPAFVREKVLAICGSQLAPHGIAYVSYKTNPGSHASRIVHDMMRYQASRRPGAPQREIVDAGLEMLRFVARSKATLDPYRALLTLELEDIEGRLKTYGGYSWVYHDLGVEISEPVSFYQFMECAAGHGLQFLAELHREVPPAEHYTPATVEFLETLEDDPLAAEQYVDFLADRNFRRTLLCRADVAVDRATPPERVYPLYAAGVLQPSAPTDPAAGALAKEEFTTPAGPKITVDQPVIKTAFRRLGQAWPAAVSFEELMGGSDADDASREEDACGLAKTLLALWRANLIQLTTRPPRMALTVSERPVASALARRQIAEGLPAVTNLRHVEVEIAEAPFRQFLLLLDGTRNRAAILRDWQGWLRTARAADPSLPPPEVLAANLDAILATCVRQQLLVA